MGQATSVVVLKTVRDRFAHSRLAVARSLGRLGVPVHTIHEDRLDAGYYSRYSAQRLSWPIGRMAPDQFLERLVNIGEQIGGRPVLVATDDAGSLLVGEHLSTLSEVYRIRHPGFELAESLSNKAYLHRLCAQMGDVPTPEVTIPKDRDEVREFAAAAAFPVVIKAVDPRVMRATPGAMSVSLARNSGQLLAAYDAVDDPSCPNLLFQEYIPGGVESQWMFNGYFDDGSRCRVAFTAQKIRQYPPDTGSTSLGVCRDADTLAAMTISFLERIGYRGVVDLGWRYDVRDDTFKLLDVNPRLGSSFRLFVAADGTDVVRALYLDLTGQPIPPIVQQAGRRWIVEPFDRWSAGQLRRAGRLSRLDWVRSVRGVDELAWWAPDDPGPFLAMTAHYTYQRLRSMSGAVAQRILRPRAQPDRSGR